MSAQPRTSDGRVAKVWSDEELRPFYDEHLRTGESINSISARTLLPRGTLQRRFKRFREADLRAKVDGRAQRDARSRISAAAWQWRGRSAVRR